MFIAGVHAHDARVLSLAYFPTIEFQDLHVYIFGFLNPKIQG